MEQAYAEWEFSEVRIEPKVRYRVAPSEPMPVISRNASGPRITMMNFGFRSGKAGRQLMARGETVSDLRMFREPFRARRCLILAHGFYDSENLGKYKQPWHLHLKGDDLMCFAGLWESTPQGDNFTIVSAPANKVVARVIDRMPVIMPRKFWHAWMDPSATPPELMPMLQAFPAEEMEAYPVTRKVNQKGFEGPECIEPIVPAQGDLGIL
jgi:putative SOS response-associated peptidase YedK